MNEVRVYHPPNWQPLERWLSASFCRREFDWMWRDEHLECYRCRQSGELLYLDPLGQCFDLTEVGPMPADFRQRFERCTGRVYNRRQAALVESEALEEEGGEEDGPGTLLPGDNSLSRIVGEWAAESKVDSAKRDALLSELDVFRVIFFSELELQCKKLLNTTLCWLQ